MHLHRSASFRFILEALEGLRQAALHQGVNDVARHKHAEADVDAVFRSGLAVRLLGQTPAAVVGAEDPL